MNAQAVLAPDEPVVLDLDGVLWRDDQEVPGAARAVALLQRSGRPVLFVTNNSSEPVAVQEAKLRRFGVEPGRGAVITSGMAVARLVRAGERVLCAGGAGLAEELARTGAEVVRGTGTEAGPFDAVVVGLHRDFDYERLRVAARAVRAGARLLASNDDATYPTPDGLVPGGGALLAAVEVAAGVRAVVAGKPHGPMADLVRAQAGAAGLVVGDRDDTDGAFARALGWRFALVLSGVTTSAEGLDPAPDVVAPSIAALVSGSEGPVREAASDC